MTTFYVGTYTRKEGHVDGKGDGIYRMTFDSASQEFHVTDTIGGMENPSFLALSPDRGVLYAVNEKSASPDGMGLFEAYDLRPESFGQRLASVGTAALAPCHVNLDQTGKMAVVTNYMGGKLCAFSLPMKAGAQPEIKQVQNVPKTHPRQDGSHLHSSVFRPDNRFLYAADLGTDRIMIYQYDARTNTLVEHTELPFFELPAGSGPRHLAFSANGKFLYVLNELSNTVAVLQALGNGNLKQLQLLSTLPAEYAGQSLAADLHLSTDGHYLYASNRGHNSIAVFGVQADGQLQGLGQVDCHGQTPRNFYPTRDGHWLLVANQDSGNIALFELQKGNWPIFVKSVAIHTPVCIVEE